MKSRSRPSRLRPSLWLKLTGSFLVVALVGVGLIALLANQVTTTEFHQFVVRGELTDAGDLADQLEAAYKSQGNWDGAAAILGEQRGTGQGRGAGRGPGGGNLILADANGRIVVSGTEDKVGTQLDAEALSTGLALQVDGTQVGTLVVANVTQIAADYLVQVNRALWLGGVGAVLVAVLLGTILAWMITKPVRHLTRAAEQITAGDLDSRVITNSSDEIGHLAATFNQMADNLAQQDELRRRMTADIAHELRTPLSIIRGQVEAIQDGIFEPDSEHLAPIHDEALLLGRLVQDLRTLSMAEAGQLALEKQPVRPDHLVQRVVAGLQPMAAEKSVTLELEVPATTLPKVNLDPDRIAQVLTNLVTNAIRHTPAGGRINVRLQAGSELVFQVDDTGPGIPPDDLVHVFDRFWRGDRSRSRDQGGAGLGLAIARQLVQAHNGRIWAESQVGTGTTFSFALPLP